MNRSGPTCKREKATRSVHYVQKILNFNVAMGSTSIVLVAMLFCWIKVNNVTISQQETYINKVYIIEIVFAMVHAFYSRIVANIMLWLADIFILLNQQPQRRLQQQVPLHLPPQAPQQQLQALQQLQARQQVLQQLKHQTQIYNCSFYSIVWNWFSSRTEQKGAHTLRKNGKKSQKMVQAKWRYDATAFKICNSLPVRWSTIRYDYKWSNWLMPSKYQQDGVLFSYMW